MLTWICHYYEQLIISSPQRPQHSSVTSIHAQNRLFIHWARHFANPFPFIFTFCSLFQSSGLKSLTSRGQVPTIDILCNILISSLIASYIISQGGGGGSYSLHHFMNIYNYEAILCAPSPRFPHTFQLMLLRILFHSTLGTHSFRFLFALPSFKDLW